ncbi:hypothetical protein [Enhygromyxa salina]|uniref:Uncharacterized protein n=1 Tax=Enhygromyxa salina TaxID=215803 RepID=A0A2S9YW78_9BACT|nr:hypothetical protein [Enhygromyxa salina]PRQ09346.1 hypothetical protein ENSA7_09350 [Enhygromyxa salina]
MTHIQPGKQIAALLVTGLLLAGCSTDSESGEATQLRAQSTDLDTFEEPFQVAIDRRVGLTVEQVREAVFSARTDAVQRCLGAAGYPLGTAQVQDIVAFDTLEAASLLEVSLAQLDEGDPWADVGAHPTQIVECLERAEAAINPQYELALLLNDATMSISRQLEKHPEMITAMRQERACVSESTFADYGVAALAEEDRAVVDIMASVHAEALSRDDAKRALTSLVDARGDLDVALMEVEACTRSRLAVERKLVIEQQQQWLAANPGWIDDIAKRYVVILQPLAASVLSAP